MFPSYRLAPYIKYYWILKTDEISDMSIQTIPTGCVHLVFHRANRFRFSSNEFQPQSFLRGQLSVPDILILHENAGIDMIAVVFNALGIVPFLSMPLYKLYNKYIDIQDLDDNGFNNLKRLILIEEDVLKCIALIEDFLLQRLSVSDDYNYRRITKSVENIKVQPWVDVLSLSDEACLGYRQFKRVFTDYVGMGPKEYVRIVRFQRALYMLENIPNISMTQLADSCGFYDSSHLTKEFKALTNCTPTQYISTHNLFSTLFSDTCKLNLICKK